jgi:phenylacetate-coenzyme A ligase PaaK-like adenylate-forming protein
MSILDYTSSLLGPVAYKLLRLDVFGRLRWLHRVNQWPLEKRAEWRLERLGDMLEFCWQKVPFYREFWGDHNLSFQRPKSIDELEAYPVLTKDVFKENAERIKSEDFDSIRKKLNSTGGTTGVPLQYYQDIENWILYQAFTMWGWGQSGYRYGDPVGIIAGYSLIPQNPGLKDRFRYGLDRKLALSGVHMDKELAASYQNKLKDYGARYIYGYPSVLSLFASRLRELELTLPKLRGIITTAEMLLPQYRQNIEDGLNCTVWDQYGCNDGGVMSHECTQHNGHHYNDLFAILQVDEADNNDIGRMLITNLWNRSMPFVRYENGDRIALSKEPCPCNQRFPLISKVEGRTADIITFPNGRSLAGPALTLIFRNMKIDGWQVVQRAADALEVRIISREEIADEDATYIRDVLKNHAGEGVTVEVKRVDELWKTKSGKLKPVWIEHC